MTNIFMPGEEVLAFHPTRLIKVGRRYQKAGWSKAVVVRLLPNGEYLVRWTAAADGHPTSSIDPDDIRHI